MTVYRYQDGSFPTSTGTLNYNRPNARFYIVGGGDDSNSVALYRIEHPQQHVIAGQQTPIVVTIKNKGYNNLDSCLIYHSVNGVTKTPFQWTGNLFDDFNSTDTIAYYTPTLSEYDTIVIWVAMPNGVVDTVTYDDTLSIITFGCESFLSGDYVVGLDTTSDFDSIADFLNVLSLCGAHGDITLKFQNGVYNQNWDLSDISKLMGTNTLTITTLSGNRDSVILRPPADAGIVLNNSNNLIIDGITIDAATSAYTAIRFTGACENVTIRNNKLYANGDVSSGNYSCIYKGSGTGLIDNVNIVNNYIDGGYYGIYLYGTGSNNYNTNIYVDSNVITNAYYYLTYFYYTAFNSVSNNNISTGTALKSSTFYGLSFYYCDVEKMCKNSIFTRTTMTTMYGVYFYYGNVSSSTNTNALIANNEILLNATSTLYGIYASYSNVDIKHNSIYANTNSTTYGIYIYGGSAAYTSNIWNNNIVCTYNSAYPIYISGTAILPSMTMDYNNYYAPSYIGYVGGAQSSLANWRTATSQDLNSVSVMPNFLDLTLNLLLLNDNGIQCPLDSAVMDDIKGLVRDSITSMGAYHFNHNDIDVLPQAIISPSSASIIGDTTQVEVTVFNIGKNTITSMYIGWEINGVAQTPYSWTGTLPTNEKVDVTIGSFFPIAKGNTLKIYTYSPNSQIDEDVSNDTIFGSTYGCDAILSGTYTVGSSSADFATMDDAMEALQYCGVKGAVVMKLENGTYNKVTLPNSIPGISKNNTVTFTSASGNANDVVIASTGVALTLVDASHLVFKNITIGDTVDNTTYAVQFIGMCENIEIRECNIYSSITSTSTSYTAIYCNNNGQSKYLKDVRILNNNIRGGYYNMYMYFICGNSSNNMSAGGVSIIGNTLSDAYNYGIYNYYYGRYYHISNNFIKNRQNATNTFYGIYSYYYTTIDTMQNNRIHITTTSSAYGMQLQYYQNYHTSYGALNPMLVANNELIISGGSTVYGIYDGSGSSYSRYNFYHNSIYCNTTSTAYGFYIYPYSSSYKYTVMGNNVYLNTTSTGYMMYFGSTSYMSTSYCTFNFNNYYKPSGTAYYSQSYTSLSAWQSGTGHDGNSYNIDPLFANPLAELVPAASILSPNLLLQKDIVGNQRISSNNNRGCYSVIQNLDAGIETFEEPLAGGVNKGTTIPVKVRLRNYGKTTLTSVTINWSIDGVGQPHVALTGISLPKFTDTVVTIGSFTPTISHTTMELKAWTSSPNGSTDGAIFNDSASVSVIVCDSALKGNYTIGTGGNYTSAGAAINDLLNCGVDGPVTFSFLSGNYPSFSIEGIIPNTNDINTITFTSATGIASDVVIGSSGTALLLDKTGNLVFKDITIGLTTTSTTYGVELKGTCENILFYQCNINSYTNATSSSYMPVRYYNTNGSMDCLKEVRFIKNNIDGGYYNMYFYYPAGTNGNMTASGMSVTIDSNTMTNSYYYGLYTYWYARYTSISYNTVTSRNSGSTTSNWYGLYIYYYNNVEKIVNNKIRSTNTAITSPCGIYAYYYLNSSNYGGSGICLLANNEVILYATSTSADGIRFYYPYSNAQVVHNSVYMYGSGEPRAFYTYNSTTSYRPEIKNNIFATNAGTGAYPIYYNSSYYDNRYFDVDYNNYYSTGNNVAYANGDITSLTALRNTTLQDANSLSENPQFINTTVNLSTIGTTMLVTKLVPYDLRGNTRLKMTNMGCYHDYVPIDLDAKPEVILSPSGATVTPSIQTPISVALMNMGNDTLTSCTIEWVVNGIAQTPYNWTGSLGYMDTAGIEIGTFVFTPGKSVIRINTNMPNNDTDMNVFNDTIWTTVCGCDSALAGVYTIGGVNSDFADLDEALYILGECGMQAAVELRLEPGTYEAVYLRGEIPGISSSSTLTFTSANGNPNSVIIRSSGGGTAFTLNNAKHLIFKYITIGTTDNTTTYGVHLSGANQNIEFYGCNIYSSTTTTTSSYAAVYYNESGSSEYALNDVRFIKNNIVGGYYNMYFYHGGGSVSANVAGRVIVDSNNLSNAYYYGVYTYCIWYFPSISYNTISNRSSNSAFTGMYLYYYTVADTVVGNRIRISNTTSTTYGIYAYFYINTYNWGAGGPMFIANNEIIITNASSTTYGIYTAGTSLNTKADVLFNSIYISNTSTTYGLYRGYVDATYKVSMLHNNVYVDNPTGTVYILYVYSSYESNTYGLIDYNNYYRNGTGTTYYGKSSYTSLNNWKASGYGHDANAVSVIPAFINPTQSLELSDYSNMFCQNSISLPYDINKEARTSMTTIGAYTTFIYNGKNMGIVKLLDPINTDEISCYQNYADVRIVYANRGSVDVEFYATPITFKVNVTGAVNYYTDTVIPFGKMLPSNRDTIVLTNLLPVMTNGTYNIDVWLEIQGDGYSSDDTLHSVYVVDRVTIPYSTNFDSVPQGALFKQITGTAEWTVESGDDINPPISPNFGTGRLQFSSATGYGSSGTVCFQPFNLQGTVMPLLKLWYAHDDNNPTKRDYTDLKVSIDGGNTFSTILHLQRYNAAYTTPTFVNYEVDLTAYSSYSCVIFMLEGGSFGGGNQNIDSLVIISKQDLIVDLDIPEESELIACELDNIPIEVKLTNRTSQLFDFNRYPTNIKVKISGAVDTTFQQPLNTGIIEGDSSILYTLANAFDFSTNGTYDILAYIDAADDNKLNDTIRITRTIQVDADLYAMDTINNRTVGDTIYPTIYIANNGNLSINGLTINISINNALAITEYVDTLLAAGDTLTYTFLQPYLIPMVTELQPFYQLKIAVSLSCDGNMSNNSISKYYEVDVPLYVDLAITEINYPIADSCETGFDKVYSSIKIANNGTGNSQGGTLTVKIDSAGIVIDTFTESINDIASNNTITHTCTQSYTVPNFNGNYTVKFTIEYDDDIDLSNNELSVVTCAKENVGVLEIEEQLWTLGQNIPNPAQTITEIPYAIPVDGTINLKIVSINGQVLYQKEMQATAGNHSIVLDIDFLSNGIYYYSMEYAGRTIVKKMTINK